jgi:potassium voltage-gated channel Shab-related subfamily B protein 2
MNLVDFIAIFPFYMELVVPSGGGDDGLLVLRLLRLGRVLRLLKLGKRNAGMIIFANAFITAGGVLGVLMFMVLLITILFGTLLHLTEGGDWYDIVYPQYYPY